MIYEIPKYDTAIDLSKVTTISRVKHISRDTDIRWWKFVLTMGMYFPQYEVKPYIIINHSAHFKYDTDKEAKKVYEDLVKAWKGE